MVVLGGWWFLARYQVLDELASAPHFVYLAVLILTSWLGGANMFVLEQNKTLDHQCMFPKRHRTERKR